MRNITKSVQKHRAQKNDPVSRMVWGAEMSFQSVTNRQRPLVLCVEDNRGNAELVRMIFRSRLDADVTFADSGEIGIEMAKSVLPDLILMDIKLPGICGIEATKLIRSNTNLANVPIIAMTASAMEADISKAAPCGFTAYITKPIDVFLFVQTVQHAFTHHAIPTA